ncbi:hypothetical protein QFZ76_009324 [Streptomyces sp. V4I2]|nr:hypothetical protein [Streptomyces sp. V4I2]
MAGPVGETNTQLGDRVPRQHRAGPDMAVLIAELRRLSAEQVRQAGTKAEAWLR